MRNRIKVRILKSQFQGLILYNEGKANNSTNIKTSQLNIKVAKYKYISIAITPKGLKEFRNPVKAIKYLMKYEKDRTRSPYK